MALAVDSFKLLVDQVATKLHDNFSYIVDVVAIVGAWYAIRISIDLGYHTFIHYRRAVFSARNFVKHYGRWAVVTGCTSGIGKQFCRQLANRGLNIVLIGRNPELCEKEARYLQNRYGARTVTIIHDFCNATPQEYSAISDTLRDKEIGILINNAGVHYDHPMYFSEVEPERLHAITQVNMTGVVMLTRAIVPIMMVRECGLIVNISSGAGWVPVPLITLYSASKAFVSHFSKSLNLELKQYNIHVQSLEPMYISTRMSKFSGLLLSTSPNAESYVRSALKSLGKTMHGTGHFPHTLQMLIIKWCPSWIVTRASSVLQHHLRTIGSQSKLKKD